MRYSEYCCVRLNVQSYDWCRLFVPRKCLKELPYSTMARIQNSHQNISLCISRPKASLELTKLMRDKSRSFQEDCVQEKGCLHRSGDYYNQISIHDHAASIDVTS